MLNTVNQPLRNCRSLGYGVLSTGGTTSLWAALYKDALLLWCCVRLFLGQRAWLGWLSQLNITSLVSAQQDCLLKCTKMAPRRTMRCKHTHTRTHRCDRRLEAVDLLHRKWRTAGGYDTSLTRTRADRRTQLTSRHTNAWCQYTDNNDAAELQIII